MLSAVGQDRVTSKAICLGAQYYVVKPFEMDVLAKRIRELVKNESSETLKEVRDTYIKTDNSKLNLEAKVTNIYVMEL